MCLGGSSWNSNELEFDSFAEVRHDRRFCGADCLHSVAVDVEGDSVKAGCPANVAWCFSTWAPVSTLNFSSSSVSLAASFDCFCPLPVFPHLRLTGTSSYSHSCFSRSQKEHVGCSPGQRAFLRLQFLHACLRLLCELPCTSISWQTNHDPGLMVDYGFDHCLLSVLYPGGRGTSEANPFYDNTGPLQRVASPRTRRESILKLAMRTV